LPERRLAVGKFLSRSSFWNEIRLWPQPAARTNAD
jgi:hypothetical protein